MDTINDFEIKKRKYMPTFPKATGKTTVYIEGYPCEDDEPMAETDFHAEQILTLSDQLKRYFKNNKLVHIAVDSFIYYREGDISKCVAPDIHIVLGVDKYPLRRSFYTWAEGAVPAAVFEFLSDSTAKQDRNKKVELYLNEIGVQEYFIHQPELEKPAEFRAWQQGSSGNVVEMEMEADGSIFSRALKLQFRYEEQPHTDVRLLRPFLPDGTSIATSMEETHLKEEAVARVEEEVLLREVETQRRKEAETRAVKEAQRRQEAETRAAEETQRRQEAETRDAEKVQRLLEAEAEIERLRAQLTNRQNDN